MAGRDRPVRIRRAVLADREAVSAADPAVASVVDVPVASEAEEVPAALAAAEAAAAAREALAAVVHAEEVQADDEHMDLI